MNMFKSCSCDFMLRTGNGVLVLEKLLSIRKQSGINSGRKQEINGLHTSKRTTTKWKRKEISV